MSHELTSTDSMVSAHGRKPWHFHLGTPVNLHDGALTLADAPAAAGLDWLVEHRPVYTASLVGMNDDGTPAMEYHEVEGHRAVTRLDNEVTLGFVGSAHHLVQNQALFDLAGAIEAESDGTVHVETAGSLRGGRHVWVLATVDRDTAPEGDKHTPYLLLSNAHDGTMALSARRTVVRVVCANTLDYALKGAQQAWTARHTEGISGKVAEIREAIGATYEYVDAWEAEARKMMATTMRPSTFEKFVERLTPLTPNPTDLMVGNVERKREVLRRLHDGPTVGDFKGTAWGAFNAATEWSQHFRKVTGDRTERAALKAITGETALETGTIRKVLDQTLVAAGS